MVAEAVPASDAEILSMLRNEELSHHRLEKVTGDALRSVQLRREFLIEDQGIKDKLPLDGFNAAAYYDQIDGTTLTALPASCFWLLLLWISFKASPSRF